MSPEYLDETQFYKTSDMPLSAAICYFLSISALEAIEKDPTSRRANFIFRHTTELDEIVNKFWRGELQIEPQAFFQQLKLVKSRLYSP